MSKLRYLNGMYYNDEGRIMEVLAKLPEGIANITSACTIDAAKGRVTLPKGLPREVQLACSFDVILKYAKGGIAVNTTQSIHQQRRDPLTHALAQAMYGEQQ
jgi:hypothetical protein